MPAIPVGVGSARGRRRWPRATSASGGAAGGGSGSPLCRATAYTGGRRRTSRSAGWPGRARVRHRGVPRMGRPGPRADRHHTPGPSAPQRYRGPPADFQVGVRPGRADRGRGPSDHPKPRAGRCMAIEDAVGIGAVTASTSAITRGSWRFGRLAVGRPAAVLAPGSAVRAAAAAGRAAGPAELRDVRRWAAPDRRAGRRQSEGMTDRPILADKHPLTGGDSLFRHRAGAPPRNYSPAVLDRPTQPTGIRPLSGKEAGMNRAQNQRNRTTLATRSETGKG